MVLLINIFQMRGESGEFCSDLYYLMHLSTFGLVPFMLILSKFYELLHLRTFGPVIYYKYEIPKF